MPSGGADMGGPDLRSSSGRSWGRRRGGWRCRLRLARQGLLLTGSGSAWTAIQAPLPANASTNATLIGELNSVACPSMSQCVAAGIYTGKSSNEQGLLLTGPGSLWTATQAPLPANATTSPPDAQLEPLACASTSECVAAGKYFSGSGIDGLLVTGSS